MRWRPRVGRPTGCGRMCSKERAAFSASSPCPAIRPRESSSTFTSIPRRSAPESVERCSARHARSLDGRGSVGCSSTAIRTRCRSTPVKALDRSARCRRVASLGASCRSWSWICPQPLETVDGGDATLRGVPPGRQSNERENAGSEEMLRSGWLYRREDAPLERQRRLQRPRVVRGVARAQSRDRDEEAAWPCIPHHRASARCASRDPRLRPLWTFPAVARREARRHVPAQQAPGEARAADRARWRAHLSLEGSEVFSAYVPGLRGPVFMTLIEKSFGKDVTTRTWETVKKVARETGSARPG